MKGMLRKVIENLNDGLDIAHKLELAAKFSTIWRNKVRYLNVNLDK